MNGSSLFSVVSNYTTRSLHIIQQIWRPDARLAVTHNQAVRLRYVYALRNSTTCLPSKIYHLSMEDFKHGCFWELV